MWRLIIAKVAGGSLPVKTILGAVALLLTAGILVVSDSRVTPWTLLDVLREYGESLDQE